MTVTSTPADSNAAVNFPPQKDSESASGTKIGLTMSSRIASEIEYASIGAKSI
jgi:hypothetical protein